MGYIGIGFLIVLVIGGITLLLTVIPYGENEWEPGFKDYYSGTAGLQWCF